MLLTRRLAAFLLLAGVFPWLVFPNFLRVVWKDDRAFGADGSPTAFLLVHVAIVVPGLLIGTGLLWLGVRAWRAAGPSLARPGRAVRRPTPAGRSGRA